MKQKEVIRLMLDGKKFKFNTDTLVFKEGVFPFIIEITGEYIHRYWENVDEWEMIKEWYDEIPSKGILCNVWDCDENEKHIRVIIKDYFTDTCGADWLHAEPIGLEDIRDYLL